MIKKKQTAALTHQAIPERPDPPGKLGILVQLMRRPEGALITELAEAAGWQNHSVRGAIAGALKKKHQFAVTSEVGNRGRVYRIIAEAQA